MPAIHCDSKDIPFGLFRGLPLGMLKRAFQDVLRQILRFRSVPTLAQEILDKGRAQRRDKRDAVGGFRGFEVGAHGIYCSSVNPSRPAFKGEK